MSGAVRQKVRLQRYFTPRIVVAITPAFKLDLSVVLFTSTLSQCEMTENALVSALISWSTGDA